MIRRNDKICAEHWQGQRRDMDLDQAFTQEGKMNDKERTNVRKRLENKEGGTLKEKKNITVNTAGGKGNISSKAKIG